MVYILASLWVDGSDLIVEGVVVFNNVDEKELLRRLIDVQIAERNILVCLWMSIGLVKLWKGWVGSIVEGVALVVIMS